MAQKKKAKDRGYGNGSIYYNEKRECWVGQYVLGTKPDGRPERRTVYGKNETEVRKKLNSVLAEANCTTYVYVQKSTVEDFLKMWLTTVKRIQLKEKSYDRLEETIEKDVVPYIGHIQVGALESCDVQNMISKLFDSGRAYSSIKKAYEAVNAAYKWGVSVRPPKVKDNPCVCVSLPNKKNCKPTEIRFYTSEEAQQIAEAALKKYPCGTPHYPLGGAIVLVLNTGLRLGELVALEWDRDIDLENRVLTVRNNVVKVRDRKEGAKKKFVEKVQSTTKSEAGQNREIPLNESAIVALNALREYTGSSKYVLATRDGNRKSARDIDKLMRRVVLRAGLPQEKVYGIHALRHTFATLMLQNNVDIKIVSELLGHSSISITYNTYIHVIKSQKRKAIAALPNIVLLDGAAAN